MKNIQSLSPQTFARDGYQVIRGLCPQPVLDALRAMTLAHLEPLVGPVEYEADVGYPGAPGSRDEQGGGTPRRLLNVYSRAEVFREWATGPLVGDRLRALFGRDDLSVSQCHHNCVMTKYPFSRQRCYVTHRVAKLFVHLSAQPGRSSTPGSCADRVCGMGRLSNVWYVKTADNLTSSERFMPAA